MLRRFIGSVIAIFSISTVLAQNEYKETNRQPALTDYIEVYQKHISAVRGGNCQMYPSCSNFGMAAYTSYNPVKATFLTADRLLRCSHDFSNYNKALTSGGTRILDFPVPNSTQEKELLRSKNNAILFSATDTSAEGKFVNFLISKRYYREALLELNRLIFYQPQRVDDTQYLNFLTCKRALNELEDAIFTYENSFPEQIKHNPEIVYELGNINFELGAFDKALLYYNDCMKSFTDSIWYEKSVLMAGLTYAKQKHWEESKSAFMSLADNSILSYSRTHCMNILQNREHISYKKPYLAGICSVVPGLGYLYAGHKHTAVSALLINGLLAYATYTNIRNENYGMAALTGVFSFSFYVANITGSVRSAKRYNSKKDYDTINKLKSFIYY